ncbi:hypothetical protein ACOALA_20675 (plasmid) [Alicyclobacillus acidoterrestris]|uniref:hypothetical protein n=1 Tax=Alicyclobacillus acidoterrestris TaxID=1450 RepID=UPI003F53A985
MQYEIVKPVSCSWELFGKVLREVQYETFRIKNRVIQLYYQHENDKFSYKQVHGEYPNDKDRYGAPFATYVYRTITPEFPVSLTNNITASIQKATKAWKTSRKDVLKGNKSIPSFRRTGPIELNASSIRNFSRTTQRGIELDLALLSNRGVEHIQSEIKRDMENVSTTYRILINPGQGGAKAILKRVMNQEYKVCGSMILRNERKNILAPESTQTDDVR